MTRIPGTRVDDNALHRASLWLEDFKHTRGTVKAITRDEQISQFGDLIRACGIIGVTGTELTDGLDYYAENFAQTIFGRLNVVVLTEAVGPISLLDILRSVWLDGLYHGIAMRDGKHGLSTTEIQAGVGRTDE